MPEKTKKEMISRMEQTIEVLKSALSKVQTGRANPAMIEDIIVDYYGAPTPLKQMSTIAAPDANLLVVQPYDKTQIAAVEKAVLSADLGLNPANDGKVVRIKVPKLSEERRTELTKIIKSKGEEAKVALRNVRRDANDKLQQMEDNGDISEDEYHRYRDKTDEAVHDFSKTVDDLIAEKDQKLQVI